ncbi:MAG: C4-dicarboxylate ABC transporter, partial [Gemmatimonadota bacterium]|nr:C4-dicarboxylate ABC transporter [Gemmatimonadota bacterium]
MTEPTWIVLLPPILAIVLAIWTRQVYLSLAAGIWLGTTILAGWNPLTGIAQTVEQLVAVLGDAGNAKVILFTLVIGALIGTVEASGGVLGFVRWIEHRRLVTSGRTAQLLAFVIGVVIFIESNITVLVAGAIGRPLFDRFRVSREKLAYLIDSTSAAVCILIPLNAWGAYVLGILGELGVERPLEVFVASIPLNFYALGAVILAGTVATFGFNLGPMKEAERRTREGQLLETGHPPLVDPEALIPPPTAKIPPRAINMLLPIGAMVLMMPLSMVITGGGDMREGSGSTSVLWAVLIGLAVAWILLLAQRAATINELMATALKGAGDLLSIAFVLLLALGLGAVANKLGTGAYIAQVTAGVLPPVVFLPLV